MKNIVYITLIYIISNWGFSQNKLTLEQDSIVPKENSKVVINPLAPAKAAFYSAIFPGLGQIYNKRYWKLPIVYGALGISTYFIINNNRLYNEYRAEYKNRLLGINDPNHPTFSKLSTESVIRGQKFYQRNRDLSILITAGLYLLNIVDANVDAHLLQFNVNDDLSLKPDFQYNQFDNKHQLGLKLSYNF